MKNIKKLLASILFFLLAFFFAAKAEAVQADTLVIQDNGAVILVIGPGAVLGETTSVPQPTKPPEPAKEQKKEEPHKTVPLIAPETKSVVKITPSSTESKKIQVTITTLPKTSTPVVQNQGTVNKTQSSPTPSITQTVDNVVAKDNSGNTVLNIRSSGKNSLTINNENAVVNTSLPLQINTQTHEFDVIYQGQTQKINVLPATVLNSLLDAKTISGDTGLPKPAISLTNSKNNVIYQIHAQNQVNFGALNIKWPVEVEISAQTGKTVSKKQPFYGSFLKLFNLSK